MEVRNPKKHARKTNDKLTGVPRISHHDLLDDGADRQITKDISLDGQLKRDGMAV